MPDKKGRRGIKLPRIGNRSFDYGKLTEIEKMKHYDDRINEICDYKEKLIAKKNLSNSRNGTQLSDSLDERSQRRLMIRNQSKSKEILRYASTNISSSN